MPSFANNPTGPHSAFDWVVFDWGFSVADIIPSLNRAIVQREFTRVEAGQAVQVVAHIQDIMTTVGQQFDFNPGTTPQIELYNPDGTTKVALTNMNNLGVTGYYGYQHQTLNADQKGVYTARFKAVDGTMTMLTDKLAVFEVTAQ